MSEPQQPPPKPDGAPSYQRGAASVPSGPPSPPPAEIAVPGQYPPPPGGPSPQTLPFGMPRRRRGLLMTLAAFGLVLLVAGGGVLGFMAVRGLRGGLAADDPGPTPAATTTAAPSPTAEPTKGPAHFAGDLRDLLIDRPAGSSRWSDFPSEDGSMTVDQMVAAFDDWDELGDKLRSLNYERGAAMHWTRRGGEAALVLLFQFDNEEHANEFALWTHEGDIEGYEERREFGDIPGSVHLVAEEPDQDGDTSAIMISSKREIVSYVTVWHPDRLDLRRATDLAAGQHQRLP
jgi:hypothetical protein